MTDQDLEQRLRAWYRADIDDYERAPQQVRTDLATLAQTVAGSRRPSTAGWRFPSFNRLAPIALIATAVVVAILIGIGLLVGLPDVGPSPIPVPTNHATAEPSGPLGGGLVLTHEARDDANPGPLDLFTLDSGTGKQTLLGTLPELHSFHRSYNLQWGADRKHVLITDLGIPVALNNPTAAGRDLDIVCCEPRAGGGVLSPQSDRIASLFEGDTAIPGCLLCTDAPAIVTVLDVDGGTLRTFSLPGGTLGNGPVSWTPDGSAVVVAGCLPCNNAGAIASAASGAPGGSGSGGDWSKLTPTAVHHAHLFIVPVDGSPVRELFDETEVMVGSPAWSPSGTSIAFLRNECPPDEHAPYCLHGTITVETFRVADGRRTALAEATDGWGPAWSPDGLRMTFGDERGIVVMDADGSHLTTLGDGRDAMWSPNGQWLLFSTYDAVLDASEGPWIISSDGGEPRLLGPYGGWAW